MTTSVLFMCPHAAGKSVIAATYFQEAVARLGLDATARVAGTDPDDAVMDRSVRRSRVRVTASSSNRAW